MCWCLICFYKRILFVLTVQEMSNDQHQAVRYYCKDTTLGRRYSTSTNDLHMSNIKTHNTTSCRCRRDCHHRPRHHCRLHHRRRHRCRRRSRRCRRPNSSFASPTNSFLHCSEIKTTKSFNNIVRATWPGV